MRSLISLSFLILAGLLSLISTSLSAGLPEEAVAILQKRCSQCHSGSVTMSELNLNSRQAVLKGGTRGAAVQPGNSAGSLIFQVVSFTGS